MNAQVRGLCTLTSRISVRHHIYFQTFVGAGAPALPIRSDPIWLQTLAMSQNVGTRLNCIDPLKVLG